MQALCSRNMKNEINMAQLNMIVLDLLEKGSFPPVLRNLLLNSLTWVLLSLNFSSVCAN
jgi:hypothetical protein